MEYLLEDTFWNKSTKSYGRTVWDSLLQALMLLSMDGDISKAALGEARIGETHGELEMDFSGIYMCQCRKTWEGHSLLD